jgi:hypothetical protein
MVDEPIRRLLDYDQRRYWLVNGWSIRFRITEIEASTERPNGIRYSFTLHDVDGARLLGFDNAHGVPASTRSTIGTASERPTKYWRTNFGAPMS